VRQAAGTDTVTLYSRILIDGDKLVISATTFIVFTSPLLPLGPTLKSSRASPDFDFAGSATCVPVSALIFAAKCRETMRQNS
jgi:hypothetical protein